MALLFSVLTVYFTGRQAIVAQQTMMASPRAWMNVGDEITVASLTWRPVTGVLFEGTFTSDNEGNSPATDVEFSPLLVNFDY